MKIKKIKLKHLLFDKNISIKELAEKTGLYSTWISNFANDNNNPTLDNLIKICDALDCNLSDLIELITIEDKVEDKKESLDNFTNEEIFDDLEKKTELVA